MCSRCEERDHVSISGDLSAFCHRASGKVGLILVRALCMCLRLALACRLLKPV